MDFKIKLTENDLYDFNIRQAYHSSQGLITIIIGIMLLAFGGYYYYIGLYFTAFKCLLLGLVIMFFLPVSLKSRTKKRIKQDQILGGELGFHLDENGIKVTAGEASDTLAWNNVYKCVSTKKHMLIYSNRVNAYIIPKAQLEDDYDSLKEIVRDNLKEYRVSV